MCRLQRRVKESERGQEKGGLLSSGELLKETAEIKPAFYCSRRGKVVSAVLTVVEKKALQTKALHLLLSPLSDPLPVVARFG